MRNSEAPEIFHFWTGVSVLAGALRRRVWIEQRHFQWTPNFYIIFVAPPGVATKSTTIDAGMRLLAEVDGIHFGPDSMTWQSMIEALKDAHEMVLSGEGDLDMLPQCCITCSVSELGTFLDPSNDAMMSVFTDLWDGKVKVWKRRTKLDGEKAIENPWINIIACTTPSWLQQNFPEAAIGGGFASRTVFVYAGEKRQLVAYPSLHIDEDAYADEQRALVQDLAKISQMVGEFKLTPAAFRWGESWYEEHWSSRPIHMASERWGGYFARKQTHIHKLAMVLSAAESPSFEISESHLQIALRMVTATESDMQRVFDSIGSPRESAATRELMQYITAYKTISKSELWRMCMHNMDRKMFTESVTAAIEANFIGQRPDGSGGLELYLKRPAIEQSSHQQSPPAQEA